MPLLKFLYRCSQKSKRKKKVFSISCGLMSEDKHREVMEIVESLKLK